MCNIIFIKIDANILIEYFTTTEVWELLVFLISDLFLSDGRVTYLWTYQEQFSVQFHFQKYKIVYFCLWRREVIIKQQRERPHHLIRAQFIELGNACGPT
jgi:hypothetical protein